MKNYEKNENNSVKEYNVKKNKKIIYSVKSIEYKTQIFDSKFVSHNKQICSLMIDNKFIELTPYFLFNKTGDITVEIIEKNPIKDYSFMFYRCQSISNLNSLYDWDVTEGINFNSMFRKCDLITSLEPLGNWDVSSGTNFSYMFYKCSLITSLNSLLNWNVKSGVNFNNMFCCCSSISSFEPLKNWDINKSANLTKIFYNCSNESKNTIPSNFNI